MNYDFLQPQPFLLLTQRFDGHLQPSSGILRRQVLPPLTSCLGKQAVPYVTQIYIPPLTRFMTGVVFQIHMASLVHLAFLLHSLSITFAPSQSMMQLFLSAWSVIADLCSITVDTLFCSLVNRLVVMFSTSVCSCSCSPCFTNICVITAITRDFLSSTLSFGCTSVLIF